MAGKKYKPTEEERKNGWTSDTLTKYMHDRDLEQAHKVLYPEPKLPSFQNNKYNPHRWRR